MLDIDPDTPLEIAAHGKALVVSPVNAEDDRSGVSKEFEQSLEKVNRRFASVLQRLA